MPPIPGKNGTPPKPAATSLPQKEKGDLLSVVADWPEPCDVAGLLELRLDAVFDEDAVLLRKLQLEYPDPTLVHYGEVYRFRGHHILIVVDPIEDVRLWLPWIREDMFFCGYPGPLLALVSQKRDTPMLMVQPEILIAGDILDHFKAIYGEEAVERLR